MWLIMALVVVGCGGGTATPSAQAPDTTQLPADVQNIQPPEAGKATLKGRALALDGRPLPNIVMRLAEVVRGEGQEGAFVLDAAQSPGSSTDGQGYFVFSNIPPQEYVVVVGDVEGAYKIATDDQGMTRVWDAKVNEITDAGEIKVDLQPTN